MTAKLTKRQQAALHTKEQLVKAARELINERGFARVSVSDITCKAQVSTGTFYTYYQKKEDIISDINQTDFYILDRLTNERSDLSLQQRLEYYCTEFLRGIERSGVEICRQWICNNLAGAPMPEAPEHSKYSYDLKALHSILKKAQEEGLLAKRHDPHKLAVLINAELYGLMLSWCMSGEKVLGSAYSAEFVREFLNKLDRTED